MAENIRVAVRIRPESGAEQRSSHNVVVKPLDDEGLVFDPDESFATHSKAPNCYRRKARDVHFHFDRVFDDHCTQQDIFDGTSRDILDGVFNGFNSSVLAYGATGAGKTYTMLGSEELPGLIFLIMMELYRRMDEIHDEKICDVTISYLEVYNETIRDLLKPSKPLAVREDPQKGVVVNQLSAHKPADAHDLLRMLSLGNANRTQHPTDANATSSRSHAVFQVFLQQKPRTAGLTAEVRTAKLLLVDLAGSERALVSKNSGARQREGANINRSLLALGNCINALAAGSSKGHVPYRDSKLTRILKDSLGGNCRTSFIANVSPSALSYEDTLNTLRYAERAKKIKVKLTENRTKIDFHATRYRSIVADLQKEVAELKKRLKESNGGDPKERADTAASCELLDKVQKETREIVNGKLVLRQRLRDIQAMQRDNITLSLRTSRLKARIQCLIPDDTRILNKLEARLLTLGQRQQELDDQYAELQDQLKVNAAKWSASYSNAVASMTVLANKVQWLRPSIQQVLDARRLEVHEVEQGRELKHLRHYANSQKSDAENTETLVQQALRLIQWQQRRLTASGGLTDEMTQSYTALVRTVQGAKSLAWADDPSTAVTPRHCLNRSFVESSPFQKLRHHRQLLAAALQSPPGLLEDLSPGHGNGNGVPPANTAPRRHESAIAAAVAKHNVTGSVSAPIDSYAVASSCVLMPTRGIMATPGTSLFRSPGETPPSRQPRVAVAAHPVTPLSTVAASSQSVYAFTAGATSTQPSSGPTSAFTAGHSSAFSPALSASQMPSSATSAGMGLSATCTETPKHSPCVSMLTSTPGIGLHRHHADGMTTAVPPAQLAFTPVLSRSELSSCQPTDRAVTSATSSSNTTAVLQPGYMVATTVNRASRRGNSSAFFSTPVVAQQRDSPLAATITEPEQTQPAAAAAAATGAENASGSEGDEDCAPEAANLVSPPSPETFIIDSPNKQSSQNQNARVASAAGGTAGLGSPICPSSDSTSSVLASSDALSTSAFLPPPPPGLKGTRQRVRGVMDGLSRPYNVDSFTHCVEDDDSKELAEAVETSAFQDLRHTDSALNTNPSETFMIATGPATANTSSTFVLETSVSSAADTLSRSQHAATATAGNGGGVMKGSQAPTSTTAAAKSVPSSRAASAVGSMSLSAALQTKPSSKSRPNTTGTTSRKQNFASLTASARAKKMPVRSRMDENADPHLGAPRRPVKNSNQLEAFKAKLNHKSAAKSNRMPRQTTFG